MIGRTDCPLLPVVAAISVGGLQMSVRFFSARSDSFSLGYFPISRRGHSADFSECSEEIVFVLVAEVECDLLEDLSELRVAHAGDPCELFRSDVVDIVQDGDFCKVDLGSYV